MSMGKDFCAEGTVQQLQKLFCYSGQVTMSLFTSVLSVKGNQTSSKNGKSMHFEVTEG